MMQLELYIDGVLWDSIQTRRDKWQWQQKELKLRWEKEIEDCHHWIIILTCQSKINLEYRENNNRKSHKNQSLVAD